MFLKPLFSPWLGYVLPALALAFVEVGTWERVTSVPGLTPVCWVFTAIGFSPVRCICSALGFLPVLCALEVLRFSLVCCEVKARRPLVALFLLVLVETKPWGERSALSRCLSFVCLDLGASCLFDGPSRASSFWGAREFIHYDKCIKATSTPSTVALTASTFCSTYVNRCV